MSVKNFINIFNYFCHKISLVSFIDISLASVSVKKKKTVEIYKFINTMKAGN